VSQAVPNLRHETCLAAGVVLPVAPLLPCADASAAAARFEALFAAHYAFVWRSLRRFGVPEAAVDDAAQQTFLIAASRLESITPDKERAFLTGTALRVASNQRRSQTRRAEVPDTEQVEAHAHDLDPESLVDWKRRRELLDQWLDALPLELRAPFVLFELEGHTVAEIAEITELPLGTVKTRLRRARQLFLARAGDAEVGHE
jgi:RNA polymerase sigma-70 factor, ECF subfamily